MKKQFDIKKLVLLNILKFRLEHSARHSTELMLMWLWS